MIICCCLQEAFKRDTGAKFAVKIIDKKLCAGKEDMIETEIAILKKVQHPHIVGMHDEYDTVWPWILLAFLSFALHNTT